MLKTVTNSINASQIQTPITFPGDVTLSTGNLVIGTSGKGIDFSATPGTGTSELLADYEEGTWTPTLTTNATGFSSVTYNALVSGYYVRVGKVVHVQGIMFTDAVTKGSASGEVAIGGLPFTAAANSSGKSDGFSSVAIGYSALFAVNQPIAGFISASTNNIALSYKLTSNGGSANTSPTDIATSTGNLVRFAGAYVAA